jgi:hypothetical protein
VTVVADCNPKIISNGNYPSISPNTNESCRLAPNLTAFSDGRSDFDPNLTVASGGRSVAHRSWEKKNSNLTAVRSGRSSQKSGGKSHRSSDSHRSRTRSGDHDRDRQKESRSFERGRNRTDVEKRRKDRIIKGDCDQITKPTAGEFKSTSSAYVSRSKNGNFVKDHFPIDDRPPLHGDSEKKRKKKKKGSALLWVVMVLKWVVKRLLCHRHVPLVVVVVLIQPQVLV